MSNQSTFNVSVNDETVSIPLARARELCPNEVDAMEAAWSIVSEAMKRNDTSTMTAASKEVEQRMGALVHALAIKLQEHKK